MKKIRTGIGFDIHPLIKKRKLILGGVIIPFKLGLEGHSDGDVLTHSICDALLGACAQRDIGYHFPSIKKYKNISSLLILKETRKKIKKFKIINIDATIIIQQPKVSLYVEEMRKKISDALEIKLSCVSVKATTSKHLGNIGKSKAIASIAIATVAA